MVVMLIVYCIGVGGHCDSWCPGAVAAGEGRSSSSISCFSASLSLPLLDKHRNTEEKTRSDVKIKLETPVVFLLPQKTQFCWFG